MKPKHHPKHPPLFEVGETVILQSRDYPQYNGEYVVARRKAWVDFYSEMPPKSIWAYNLHGCIIEGGNSMNLWNESALRKKPKGGDDFKSIMKDLKLPTGEPA